MIKLFDDTNDRMIGLISGAYACNLSVLFLLKSLRSKILEVAGDLGRLEICNSLPLSRKSFKEILPLLSFSQVSLQERQCVTMKTMSNVLSMRRGEGNYLEQHLNSLRSSCLQSNIPSLSSILLSPHILRKPSFELWDDRDSGDNKEQPEYHSATKPWILERPPGSRRATEELPSTPSSSFSSTRRFSCL